MSVKNSTPCMFWHISLWLKRLPCLLSKLIVIFHFFGTLIIKLIRCKAFMWILWLLICSVRWILLHFWVANVWVMMYINSLILSSEGFICLLLMRWPRKRNNIALFPINVFKLSKLRKLAYKVLLFHYYLILPYKVKRTCKIWGHNTLHCSVLV